MVPTGKTGISLFGFSYDFFQNNKNSGEEISGATLSKLNVYDNFADNGGGIYVGHYDDVSLNNLLLYIKIIMKNTFAKVDATITYCVP